SNGAASPSTTSAISAPGPARRTPLAIPRSCPKATPPSSLSQRSATPTSSWWCQSEAAPPPEGPPGRLQRPRGDPLAPCPRAPGDRHPSTDLRPALDAGPGARPGRREARIADPRRPLRPPNPHPPRSTLTARTTLAVLDTA